MSLFPAYANLNKSEAKVVSGDAKSATVSSTDFKLSASEVFIPSLIEESTSDDESSCSVEADVRDEKPKSSNSGHNIAVQLEFSGDEGYFVDKKGESSYKHIKKLRWPACAKYVCDDYRWSENRNRIKNKKFKRYFNKIKTDKRKDQQALIALEENEFICEQKTINKALSDAPDSIQNWLDLLKLQEKNPYKWSRLFVTEKKIEILERALQNLPKNEQLYQKYVNVVSETYPAFEVSEILENLLSKDPFSYTLWTAQIMATQGSMARCIVPDVLKIYERCMSKMHHGKTLNSRSEKRNGNSVFASESNSKKNSDLITLKFFHNCAQFLRAAGLYEQFFALVKLALELNVSVDKFNDLVYDSNNQKMLIEYEELILQSGLPMNEIWLRIEKLRQGFNFLPQINSEQCSDIQCVVFNEDVCHYVYPLEKRENSFQLIIIILRLLKVPIIYCEDDDDLRLEAIGDSDAIEDTLATCIRPVHSLSLKQHEAFLKHLYDLIKEMVVTPTFLSNCIGHDVYAQTVSRVILNCSEAQDGKGQEIRRIIFLLIWCRFERLQMSLAKVNGKLSKDLLRSGRNRFKNLLKRDVNRNSILLYIEFALYEYESLDAEAPLDSVKSIFNNIVGIHDDATLRRDYIWYAYATYVEILIAKQCYDDALRLLNLYILHQNGQEHLGKEGNSNTTALLALKSIQNKTSDILAKEYEKDVMRLEDHFLPDSTVCLLKLRTYLEYLIGQRASALEFLDKHLQKLGQSTGRHRFLRERIFEIQITLFQLPNDRQALNEKKLNFSYREKLFAAVQEFPRNTFFLEHCAMLSTIPWYQLRSTMFTTNRNIFTLVFTMVALRFRLSRMIITDVPSFEDESTFRNRILNIFSNVLDESPQSCHNTESNSSQLEQSNKALKRNALFWRFYLRCLSDKRTNFDISKKCLFTALDECPWSKALYLDGATFVPQEFSHLQDLLIEKQLRIYALPEELQILREHKLT